MDTKSRLLIIEDDSGIRRMLEDFLSHYELVFASCQREAYEHLQKDRFDLVLLDLRLPQREGDMSPTNQVGIDILKAIRSRGLLKRGPGMTKLPVIVMTAYGSERLGPELLLTEGAVDYLPKPFDSKRDIEAKIRRALNFEAALVPAATIGTSPIHLAFKDENEVVRVETTSYSGAHFELLTVLKDLFVADTKAFLAPGNFRRIRGRQLEEKLGISGTAVRKRFWKFRKDVARDLKNDLGRVIGDQDIIDNDRKWDGYRLNPWVVRVVDWEKMPDV